MGTQQKLFTLECLDQTIDNDGCVAQIKKNRSVLNLPEEKNWQTYFKIGLFEDKRTRRNT